MILACDVTPGVRTVGRDLCVFHFFCAFIYLALIESLCLCLNVSVSMSMFVSVPLRLFLFCLSKCLSVSLFTVY